jgi:aminocarboxymuconate-semialdehyde decarboxylase
LSSQKISIDVHNHIYTRSHIQAIERFGAPAGWHVRESPIADVRMLVGDRGYPFLMSKTCYDMEERIKALDAANITFQVMSPSEPFFDFVDPEESVKLAKQVNDEISDTVEKYHSRLAGLAGLPLKDCSAAVEEVKRATGDRGLKGVIIPTKMNGVVSIASPEFEDLWRALEDRSVPVFLHPTLPKGAEAYKEHFLGMMVVYPSETSLTVSQMIFGGLFDRYPRLRIMLADLGGALPMLAGRMERFYSSIKETREDAKRKPIEYLKEFYYENGSEFHTASMTCCLSLTGSEHMLLGTNYPSPIGQLSEALKSIDNLELTEDEKKSIFYTNAKELFALSQI